jgi:DNA-directed RNA polymerase I, II, and III subunit RPABC2
MENKQNVVSDDEGDDINSQANESNVDTDADTNTTGDVNVSNLSEADSETSDIYEQGEEGQQQEGQQGQGQQEENASVSNSGSVSEYDDDDDDDNDDEDDYDENHLQKFDSEAKKKYIASFHPESLSYNNEETESMSRVTRNDSGTIIDPFHKTLPFLTKYEKTRILGIRTKQLNEGAKPYVDVNPTIIDGYIIAQLELEHKKLPFIIRRPMPNGSSELWRLQDLEIIC